MRGVRAVTAREMAEIDRRTMEEFHIDLTMMMENAGRALALQSRRMLGSLERKKILIMAGKGNNGGGGLASARALHNYGADVEVILSCSRDELRELPARQFQILDTMGVHTSHNLGNLRVSAYDLVIDSLLGYNQRGDPRGEVAGLVEIANESSKPIIALDVPSGLDPDRGTPNKPCIRATQTLTLALPKKGLLEDRAKQYVGKLFLADISIPRILYRELGVSESIFSESEIVNIA